VGAVTTIFTWRVYQRTLTFLVDLQALPMFITIAVISILASHL
jgi:hypothetical protein